MSPSPARRLGVIAGPVLAGALVLASCGAEDDAASVTTIDLSSASTAFVVRPPATATPPVDSVEEGGVVTTEQEYVVQSGDTPIGVAQKFGVAVADLIAYNEWGPNQFAFPGETIKIPPGGTAPAASGETATAAGTDQATTPAGTIPDAGDNCAEGRYTLAAGDIPLRVARKFDVSLDALNAANAGTPGYSSFIVGTEIVIPAKANC
jgi:LysM repeat protein